MALKQRAIPWPAFEGKTVLDVGCDHGHWCWFALDRGAARVVGLDRNRPVAGHLIDLVTRNQSIAETDGLPCQFHRINLGKEWREFGRFDVVLMMSLYHHVYELCGDHAPIWFWLWRHTAGELIWENPTACNDSVVRQNVSPLNMAHYTRREILDAARRWFEVEEVGPALHVPTREVWRCVPKVVPPRTYRAAMRDGARGATKAFEWMGCRRIGEIERITGLRCVPGSLNLWLWERFDQDGHGYYRAQVLDAADRKNMSGEWFPRWARFYPVTVNGEAAFSFRFEGERYDDCFVEAIAPYRLRDRITSPVTLGV